MVNNVIIVKNGDYVLVKQSLKQWLDLYAPVLREGMTFHLIKTDENILVIKADPAVDNEFFFYLVNYLKYPENIEYNVDVVGYTVGKQFRELKDKQLMVYIPSHDKEYDNVFLVTFSNEHYKIDFGLNLKAIIDQRLFENPPFFRQIEVEELVVEKKGNRLNQENYDFNVRLTDLIPVDVREKMMYIIILALINIFLLILFWKR